MLPKHSFTEEPSKNRLKYFDNYLLSSNPASAKELRETLQSKRDTASSEHKSYIKSCSADLLQKSTLLLDILRKEKDFIELQCRARDAENNTVMSMLRAVSGEAKNLVQEPDLSLSSQTGENLQKLAEADGSQELASGVANSQEIEVFDDVKSRTSIPKKPEFDDCDISENTRAFITSKIINTIPQSGSSIQRGPRAFNLTTTFDETTHGTPLNAVKSSANIGDLREHKEMELSKEKNVAAEFCKKSSSLSGGLKNSGGSLDGSLIIAPPETEARKVALNRKSDCRVLDFDDEILTSTAPVIVHPQLLKSHKKLGYESAICLPKKPSGPKESDLSRKSILVLPKKPSPVKLLASHLYCDSPQDEDKQFKVSRVSAFAPVAPIGSVASGIQDLSVRPAAAMRFSRGHSIEEDSSNTSLNVTYVLPDGSRKTGPSRILPFSPQEYAGIDGLQKSGLSLHQINQLVAKLNDYLETQPNNNNNQAISRDELWDIAQAYGYDRYSLFYFVDVLCKLGRIKRTKDRATESFNRSHFSENLNQTLFALP